MNEVSEVLKELDGFEKQIKKGFDGTITNVIKTTSKAYFGETDRDYENRKGLKVVVKTEGTEFSDFFAIPTMRGLHKSKIYDFKKKYGEFPKVGIPVKVVIGGDGFYQIDF